MSWNTKHQGDDRAAVRAAVQADMDAAAPQLPPGTVDGVMQGIDSALAAIPAGPWGVSVLTHGHIGEHSGELNLHVRTVPLAAPAAAAPPSPAPAPPAPTPEDDQGGDDFQ